MLVAILKDPNDLSVLFLKLWYRIPVDSVEKFLHRRWAPEWVSFYQTSVFGPDKHAIQYYGKVKK